jgi:hypothetical protein
VASERCAWEVQRALDLSKRIVPVVGVAVADDAVPAALQRLNYIYFTPGQSFARSLGQLADTLRLDIEWIREHTRIGDLAQRWTDRKHPEALLLRGEELSNAQVWMSNWKPALPQLTELHRAFIAASGEAQQQRESFERQRNEAMALANTERAEALARREDAVRSLKRRTLLGGAGALGLSLALGGVTLWSMQIRRRAEEAERQSLAEAIRKEAMRKDLSGQIVAYAASPGQMAMDSGPSGNSPYTGALLKELDTPQVSLWAALSRTSMLVTKHSGGNQRPFIASDMNGDLYLRMPSPTSQRKAIVIGAGRFEHVQGITLPGVYKDVEAWTQFLRVNGFGVNVLRDPTHAAVVEAVDDLRVADSGTEEFSLRRVGIRVEPEAASKPEAVSEPKPDTLALLFYAGMGFLSDGDRYLAVLDTQHAKGRLQLESAISVSHLEKALRERAAASVLVFDTNFF